MISEKEFATLTQAYASGEADASQVEQLNALLRSSKRFRDQFRSLMDLDSVLSVDFVESEDDPSLFESNSNTLAMRRLDYPSHGTLWGSVAVAIAASLLVGFWWMSGWQSAGRFATVVSATGDMGLKAGEAIGGSAKRLERGVLEILTERGVRVVIEAPALFAMQSHERLYLEYGRLAADVPEGAEGFTVSTPTGEALDLGTTFGVDAPVEGQSEIHVFHGEVVAKTVRGGELTKLNGGEAYRLQSEAGERSDFRSAAFILPNELSELRAAIGAGQVERALASTDRMKEDDSLIALIDFETVGPDQGTYRTVQGRWPGSQAAEFVHVGEHLKLDVGGEQTWPELTLAAWVRLDRLGAPYQSLLHTDGWESTKAGQVHWMVTRLMTMRLALKNNTLAPGERDLEGYADSRTQVIAERGRWMHLAAVYDSEAKSVRFYFNGRFDNETKYEEAFPARLGPSQVGNWSDSDRILSGRIDEMLILGRCMSDAEIEDLYDSGNPYR